MGSSGHNLKGDLSHGLLGRDGGKGGLWRVQRQRKLEDWITCYLLSFGRVIFSFTVVQKR